jgi:nucleolar protein 58
MFVLYETPAGYALFKCKDSKLAREGLDELYKEFESVEKASKLVKLEAFQKFENTAKALEEATSLVEGSLSHDLKKFLKKKVGKDDVSEKLAVSDPKLASAIAKKLGLQVVSDASVQELYRGIRSQLAGLLEGVSDSELGSMSLGLSHSLSRYKLKFSPDKVDTMIIQAIALLDDLDKELNTYSMRLKEWYGWHFPELAKIVADNAAYARLVLHLGLRTNCAKCDLSAVLPEELIESVKAAAEISMGTEISEEDLLNISSLAEQIVSISEYRGELYEYLKNRMMAIAPNLTAMVGELVGARLISHAGSLMNLAKYPASTVQILGAEKALFRALKTKHDTPKYGLIFHASVVGQAAPKLKGKISRVLAAKTSLAVRADALGDKETPEIGIVNRMKVEERLRVLEGQGKAAIGGVYKAKPAHKQAEMKRPASYSTDGDVSAPMKKHKKNKE